MIIKNMFSKPIDRDIKGVIKVGQDDNANIKQELEEYVCTNEITASFRNCKSILPISFPAIKKALTEIRIKWVFGFPVSLEVVNLTS